MSSVASTSYLPVISSRPLSNPSGSSSTSSKRSEEDETRFLDSLLESSFGWGSPEKACWEQLIDSALSPDTTTPQELGMAAGYAGIRQFLMDEAGLLGGGYAPWQLRPVKNDGGKEVLSCCTRNAQDAIHTLFSRSRSSVQGDYSIAKETARRSMIAGLVKLGELPSDHERRGSSTRVRLDAADEGSILELPHLSPSLHPTEGDLTPPAIPSPTTSQQSSPINLNNLTLPLASANSMLHSFSAQPPLTPADSPKTRQFMTLGPAGKSVSFGEATVFEEEEEGMRTPTGGQTWQLA